MLCQHKGGLGCSARLSLSLLASRPNPVFYRQLSGKSNLDLFKWLFKYAFYTISPVVLLCSPSWVTTWLDVTVFLWRIGLIYKLSLTSLTICWSRPTSCDSESFFGFSLLPYQLHPLYSWLVWLLVLFDSDSRGPWTLLLIFRLVFVSFFMWSNNNS